MNRVAMLVGDELAPEWRWVPGYPAYAVSDVGTIVNWAKDRVLKPHRRGDGYLTVGLYRGAGLNRNTRQTTLYVHRIVCEAFHGAPPAQGMHAAHRNGDRSDNTPANLRWATPAENLDDKRDHGTHGVGEKHPGARLTRAQVIEIRSIKDPSPILLASDYGVSRAAIYDVLERRSWIGVEP